MSKREVLGGGLELGGARPRETAGGTIGLFVDSLIYSTCQPLDGLSSQEFAEKLVQFAHNAQRITDELSPHGA